MNLQWYDWVGMAGTLMILGGFALLQARTLSGTGLPYQLLNLFGALGERLGQRAEPRADFQNAILSCNQGKLG